MRFFLVNEKDFLLSGFRWGRKRQEKNNVVVKLRCISSSIVNGGNKLSRSFHWLLAAMN